MSEEIIRVPLPERITGGALESFNSALLQMDDYRASLAEAGDWESLSHGLANLMEFKKNLAAVIQSIETDIYKLMPDKKTPIEGLGIVEKRRSNTKKWDSERLLHRILDMHISDNGELDAASLVETIEKVMPLTPSMGWRVTALKELGIDIDNYCDITWGRQTISIK